MPKVHVVEESPVSADRVLAAARDFSARRAELWRDVYLEHFEVHDAGETWADVTEGNRWPIGFVWERVRYDWSVPGALKGRVTDSNIFKPGSSWEIHATPLDGGGSRVEIFAERHLRGAKGWMLAPLFPLGLARRDVAAYLRRFLSKVEEQEEPAAHSGSQTAAAHSGSRRRS